MFVRNTSLGLSSIRIPVSGGHPTSSFFSETLDSPRLAQSSRPQSSAQGLNGYPTSSSKNSTIQSLQSAPASVQLSPAALSVPTSPSKAPSAQPAVTPSSLTPSKAAKAQNFGVNSSSAQASISGSSSSTAAMATSFKNQGGRAPARSPANFDITKPASNASLTVPPVPQASGSATTKPVSTSTLIAVSLSAAGFLLIGIPLIILVVRRKRQAESRIMSKKSKISSPFTHSRKSNFISPSSRKNLRTQETPIETSLKDLVSKSTSQSWRPRRSIPSFGPGPSPTSPESLPRTEIQQGPEQWEPKPKDCVIEFERAGFERGVGPGPGPFFRGEDWENTRSNYAARIPLRYNAPLGREQTSPDAHYYHSSAPNSLETSTSEAHLQRREFLPSRLQTTRIIAAPPPPKRGNQQIVELPNCPIFERYTYMSHEFPRTPISAVMAARRGSAGSLTESATGIHSIDGSDSDSRESPHTSSPLNPIPLGFRH